MSENEYGVQRWKLNYRWRFFRISLSLSYSAAGWHQEGQSGHWKLASKPMDRQLPDSIWSISGRVDSYKDSPKVDCFNVYPGQTFNPILAWKKADIFKIKGDDDEEPTACEHGWWAVKFIYIHNGPNGIFNDLMHIKWRYTIYRIKSSMFWQYDAAATAAAAHLR